MFRCYNRRRCWEASHSRECERNRMTSQSIDSPSTKATPTKNPRCSRCGACCLREGSGFTMTPADFRRWKSEKRQDILRYIPLHHTEALDHDVWVEWMDPDTHESLPYCPFLTMVDFRAYACSINETKPDICRAFWCEWSHGVGRRGKPLRSSSRSGVKAAPLV